MPKEQFEAFEKRFGVRPVEGYGTTELSPLVSVNIPPSRSQAKYQIDREEGSVGRPLPGVAAKVVEPETDRELLAGEMGCHYRSQRDARIRQSRRTNLVKPFKMDGMSQVILHTLINRDSYISRVD